MTDIEAIRTRLSKPAHQSVGQIQADAECLLEEVERLTKSRDYYKDSFETSQNFEKIERDKVIKLRAALSEIALEGPGAHHRIEIARAVLK